MFLFNFYFSSWIHFVQWYNLQLFAMLYLCILYICLKLCFDVSIENTSSIKLWIESHRQYFKCYPIQCWIKLFVYHFSSSLSLQWHSKRKWRKKNSVAFEKLENSNQKVNIWLVFHIIHICGKHIHVHTSTAAHRHTFFIW